MIPNMIDMMSYQDLFAARKAIMGQDHAFLFQKRSFYFRKLMLDEASIEGAKFASLLDEFFYDSYSFGPFYPMNGGSAVP